MTYALVELVNISLVCRAVTRIQRGAPNTLGTIDAICVVCESAFVSFGCDVSVRVYNRFSRCTSQRHYARAKADSPHTCSVFVTHGRTAASATYSKPANPVEISSNYNVIRIERATHQMRVLLLTLSGFGKNARKIYHAHFGS